MDGPFVKALRNHRVNVAVARTGGGTTLDVVVDVGLDLDVSVRCGDCDPPVVLKLVKQAVDEMQFVLTAELFGERSDAVDLLIDLPAVLRQECSQRLYGFLVLRVRA